MIEYKTIKVRNCEQTEETLNKMQKVDGELFLMLIGHI